MDTAGIRRKSKVTENVEYYSVTRAIQTIENADVVLLMIDGVEGLSDQDKKIANQIVKKGKGVVLVINKWDKLKKIPNMVNAVEDRIRFLFPILDFAPIVPISALENEGIDELLKAVYKVWRQLNIRVSTSSLNKALKDWVEDNPPPVLNNARYKIRYMTQISANPSRFLLFVNKSKKFPASYLAYIKNKIRKSFGISSIPVDLSIKETRKIWKEN
jgi:GTP-binding protein